MTDLWLSLCLFIVAVLFACVGQAGAPGYVAVMTVFGFDHTVIRPTALALTVLVATIGVIRFWRIGLLRWRDLWPFMVLGIPGAVLGGMLELPADIYRVAMTVILLGASFQMAHSAGRTATLDDTALDAPPIVPAIIAGGVIGLVAGTTGIGGGIFTASIMMFLRWAPTWRVAAVAQSSNLFTALPAFLGIWIANPSLPSELGLWSAAAGAGGLLGAWAGSKHLPAKALRYILAAILLASGLRMALG